MSEMTDQEAITKAVELADGWNEAEWAGYIETPEETLTLHVSSQIVLDALAAQLVRQVDALGEYHADIAKGETRLWDFPLLCGARSLAKIQGPDRTMNTLRAIVESGVLEAK